MIFFDIETEANKEALQFLDEPTPPGNYKDPDKIAEWIEAKKLQQQETAALDPDLGKIIAIGYMEEHMQITQAWIDGEDMDEFTMLASFWALLENHLGRCCGYNITNFDLPYMLRRSMELGVKVGMKPYLGRYRTDPTCDLMGILYNWGAAKGLKWVAKRYGIPNELPDLDGSMVATMDKETLREYVISDVKLVKALYDKMYGVYF